MDNIVEPGKSNYLERAGQWNESQFSKKQPLVVELACGKGEYSVGLAKEFPLKNFVGMDIKGSRIYVGGKQSIEFELQNVAFLRGKIENLRTFFSWREVDELWITFPDPRPKAKDEKRRLTSAKFLRLYQHVLKENAILHLKTDNLPLFEYSVEMVRQAGGTILGLTNDLYESEFRDDHHGIKTYFENKFTAIGFKINYLRFQLPELDEPKDPISPLFFEEYENTISTTSRSS